MTLFVLGDLKKAHRWLAYAYDVERAIPGSLRTDRRALLDRGWFELGQRLQNQPVSSPQPPGTALAASGAPTQAPPVREPDADPNDTQRSLVPH